MTRAPGPERAALAAAIEKQRAAEKRHAEIEAAAAEAESQRLAASMAVERAEEALSEATANEAENLSAVLIGDAPVSTLSVGEAKRDLAKAEETYRQSRQADSAFAPRIKEARQAAIWAADDVRVTALKAIQSDPAVAKLVRSFRELLDTYKAAWATVAFVHRTGGLSRELMELLVAPERGPTGPTFDSAPGLVQETDQLMRSGVREGEPDPRWIAAVAALLSDPDAELPA